MAAFFIENRGRVQKLRTMSASELAARAGYELQTAWERSRHGQKRTNRDRLASALTGRHRRNDLRLQTLLADRREKRPAFFSSVENRAGMQDQFRTRYASGLEASRQKAEQTRKHAFEFFGQGFVYGAEIDWHSDPESGRQWPRVYHGDVPIHDAANPFGDVKYVWELNRQQFLADLGKVCFLDSSPAHATAAAAMVRSWIAQNPVGTGVNWACALEPAFRTFSWLWTYQLCFDSEGLDDESHLDWLSGFHDHGQFLDRHLEMYASPYNHLIGEAAALYALGVMFPEFRHARSWRRRGRHILEARLDKQFYSDGGSVEQSTFYHHATLGFYLFAALLGRANNEEFATPIWHAIERAIEFSMSVIQPDGCTPPIGGADDGKPIRLEHRPLWDFRAFQATGAVLFARPDMKHVAGDFPEDALWLLGPSGVTRFDALASSPPRDTCIALETSGYFVARTAWTSDADYLCFDCGEQADSVRRDDVPNAVHGHADCLSATVWLGGRPVLVDPGMYRYNGDASWVGHFRRTGAHNTVTVDSQDQARYHGKMSWSNGFLSHVETWRAESGQALVMGSHDGFFRLTKGVIHRRVAWLRPDNYVILLDEVAGEGAHRLALRYQFGPGFAKLLSGNGLLFDDFAEVGWVASVPTINTLSVGGPQPGDGWIATSLGVKRPAPVLVVTAPFEAPRTVILAAIANRNVTAGAPRVAVVRNANRGIAMAVHNRDSVDWIVSGDVGDVLPFHTDAKVAVWKVRRGRIVETDSVEGRHMHPCEGDAIGDLPPLLVPPVMVGQSDCV